MAQRRFTGSQKILSAKVAKVFRDAKAQGKTLTQAQAVGKAAGILAGEQRKRR